MKGKSRVFFGANSNSTRLKLSSVSYFSYYCVSSHLSLVEALSLDSSFEMWQQIEMYPMATANGFLFKTTVYKSSIAVHESLIAILSQNPKPKLLTNRDLKTIKVSLVFSKCQCMCQHLPRPSLFTMSTLYKTKPL